MTNLAMYMFEIPASMGIWMFLSIGAVTLFVVFIPVTTWIQSQRMEREAFYKAETIRRVTESSGEGARGALELLREQDRIQRAKRLEGLKIGGLVNLAIGVALIPFLHMLIPNEAVFMCGLIPAMIGVALLTYVLFLAKPVQ